MRILCIVQRYSPAFGGSELLTKKFMDYLSKNHEITVFTTNVLDIRSFWNKKNDSISNIIENYPVHRYSVLIPKEIRHDDYAEKLSLSTNYPGPFLPKLWNDIVFEKINYDLIFATAFPYDHIIPAFLASKKWKIPLLIAPLIHQNFPSLYLNGLKLTMLNESDGIIALTESEKNLLLKYGIDQNKIFVIPPGIETPIITKNTNFRKTNSISDDSQIVLFIGSKSNDKGIIHLIESMKKIWKRSINAKLVIIGSNTKEYENYIQKLDRKTISNIIDLGNIENEIKHEAISESTLFVMPSQTESFGLVYLEAWSHQKPVIGCDIPSTKNLIENETDGLLVEFGNVEQLTEAILKVLTNDDFAKKLGKNGEKKIQKFDWLKSCEKFEQACNLTINNFKQKDSQST